MRIEQLYCTHCTYGTSALHRKEGPTKDQSFDYSARATSVGQQASHDTFRQIEPYIYFHLPGDVPAAEILGQSKDNTPRRLIFIPDINGRQMVAHCAYRPFDTQKRPRSHFAHVLLTAPIPPGTRGPLSNLDALKLWGLGNWVVEDKPTHPHEIPAYESDTFKQKFALNHVSVSDHVLLQFLTAEKFDPAADPKQVVPEAWRKKTPAERQEVLAYLVQKLTEIDFAHPDKQQMLVIAAEPSLAALLFYGMLRLLPEYLGRDKISVSTYESHVDRPLATLTNLWFHNPPKAAAEATRLGLTLNTLDEREMANRLTDFRRKPSFGQALVARLVAKEGGGWPAIEALHKSWKTLDLRSYDEMLQILRADDVVQQFTTPLAAGAAPPALPTSKTVRAYVRSAVAQKLVALSDVDLGPLTEDSRQTLRLLELLAAEKITDPALAARVEMLLSTLPEPNLKDLVGSPEVDVGYKTLALLKCVSVNADEAPRLPKDCEFVWPRPKSAIGPTAPEVLEELCARLDEPQLTKLIATYFAGLPEDKVGKSERVKGVIAALFKAAGRRPDAASAAIDAALTHPKVTGMANPEDFRKLSDVEYELLKDGPLTIEWQKRAQPALVERLQLLLRDLSGYGTRFRDALQTLVRCEGIFPDRDKDQIHAWERVAELLQEIDQTKPAGGMSGLFGGGAAAKRDALGSDLKQAAVRALPDMAGADRADLLSRIASRNGTGEGLPPTIFDQLLDPHERLPGKRPPKPTPSFEPQDLEHLRSGSSGGKLKLASLVGMILVTLGTVLYFTLPAGYRNQLLGMSPAPVDDKKGGTKKPGSKASDKKKADPKKPVDPKREPGVKPPADPPAVAETKPTPDPRTKPSAEPSKPEEYVYEEKNQALRFEAGGQPFELPDSAGLPDLNADFAIEAWLRWEKPITVEEMQFLGTLTGEGGWHIKLAKVPNTADVVFKFAAMQSDGKSIYGADSAPVELVLGRWYYLAVDCSGAGLRVVVDQDVGKQVPLRPMKSGSLVFVRPPPAPLPGLSNSSLDVRALRFTPSALARDLKSAPPLMFDKEAAAGAYVLDFAAGYWKGDFDKQLIAIAAPEVPKKVEPPTPAPTPTPETPPAPPGGIDKPLGQLTRVATYFYELPKVPQTKEEENSLKKEPEIVEGSEDAVALDLHGLAALNRWVAETYGEDSAVYARQQGARLEITLERKGSKQSNLLAEVLIKDRGAVWQWKYAGGNHFDLQGRLERCVLDVGPKSGASRLIALHGRYRKEPALVLTADKEEFTASINDALLPVKLRGETVVLGDGHLSGGSGTDTHPLDPVLNDAPKLVRKVPGLASLLKSELKLDEAENSFFNVEVNEVRVKAYFAPNRATLRSVARKQIEDGPGKEKTFLAPKIADIAKFDRANRKAQDAYFALVNWAKITLPKRTDFQNDEAFKNRMTEVGNNAHTKAQERVKAIDAEIKQIEDRLAARIQKLDDIFARTLPLATVVYRIVDPEIQGKQVQGGIAVPVVIFGDPPGTGKSER